MFLNQFFLILLTPILSTSYEFDYKTVARKLLETKAIQDNFENVQEGKFRFWQTTDCLTILYENSPFLIRDGCYFQNPNAPYGLILLPPHLDEITDQYYGFPVSDGNLSATWHMKENEAIVIIGNTPPKCKYFGFSNYLYSRHFPEDWIPLSTESKINLNCPNGSIADRCEIFASLDDSLNFERGLNLNKDIFNTSFALILSHSVEATNLALKALVESGVNKDLISNYSFPAKKMTLGIDTTDDTFITIMRTAFYENNTQAVNYFNNVPYKVFRMELINKTVSLYDRRTLINRKTAYTDASVVGITLDELKKNIKKTIYNVINTVVENKDERYIQITQTHSGVPDNGFECIGNGTMCLADCRDTVYPFSTEMYKMAKLCENDSKYCFRNMNGTLTNDDNDAIIVVGINHALTNMAAYSSIAIYDATYLWGVYAIGNTELENTSYNYIRTTPDYNLAISLPYIYVYEFRRNCGNIKNCLEIPIYPTTNNTAFIPLSNPIAITERMYNNPDTHVGPFVDDVILPTVIHIRNRNNEVKKNIY